MARAPFIDEYDNEQPFEPQQEPEPQAFAAPVAPAPPQFQREQFRDAWLGTGRDLNAQNALLGQYGLQPNASGVVTLPTGEQLDLRRGAKAGDNTAQWMGVGSGLKYGQAPSAGTPGQGQMSPSTFGGSVASTATTTGGGTGIDAAVRDALLQLMNRSKPGAIDPNTDPNLSPQARAYQAARTRAAQQQRAQAAERAAAEGLNLGGQGSGAFDAELNSIQEAAGQDIAGQQAGLVGQEVQARRQDLLQGLALASAVGARDQEVALRQQLSQLDAQLRREALAQQGQQFGAELGQRASQFGQELGFRQGQWNDTYGLNRAQFEAGQNRDALLAALGG